jgi:uncharacterized protein (TIGR03435 family)
MKKHDENLRDVFDRHMPPAAPGTLEDAAARVLRRLRAGRHHEPIEEQPAVSRLRYGPRFAVAAAVLIGMVGMGLYAIFPVQQGSPLEAMPPTQVAGVTQGAGASAARLQLPRLKFAAASVRRVPGPAQPGGGQLSLFKCLGVDGLLWTLQDMTDPTPGRRGRCTGRYYLGSLVRTAYASSPMNGIEMAPHLSSIRFENFQLDAIADDPERVTKGELQQMLQALLEDRFKARVHVETRELDGFVLTIAKSGIKFKETLSGETGSATGDPHLNGKYTMERVARFLGFMLGSGNIADRTGLTGIYDIKFDLEEILLAPPVEGVRGGPGGRGARQFKTPVPKALEDQLGLRLERARIPVEFIVVDHLELPTEN